MSSKQGKIGSFLSNNRIVYQPTCEMIHNIVKTEPFFTGWFAI